MVGIRNKKMRDHTITCHHHHTHQQGRKKRKRDESGEGGEHKKGREEVK